MLWEVASEPQVERPVGDIERWRYELHNAEGECRDVFVELSGTVAACDPATLPSPLDEAARTRGRSVVDATADRVEPPAVITITTTAISLQPRHGSYGPRDGVYVRERGDWHVARVTRLGEPDEAIQVPDTEPERRADVVWVRLAGEDVERRFRYADVRPLPPTG